MFDINIVRIYQKHYYCFFYELIYIPREIQHSHEVINFIGKTVKRINVV